MLNLHFARNLESRHNQKSRPDPRPPTTSCDGRNIVSAVELAGFRSIPGAGHQLHKIPSGQLLLTLFIEQRIPNNIQPALKAWSYTQTPLTVPTQTRSLLHLVSWSPAFSHSVPLSPFVFFHSSFIPSDCCPIRWWSAEEWGAVLPHRG